MKAPNNIYCLTITKTLQNKMSCLVVLFMLGLTIPKPALSVPISNCTAANCRDVFDNFSMCSGFVEGALHLDSPLYECCHRIAYLNAIANRERGGPARICRCIENYAMYEARLPFDAYRIQELPRRCNTHLSFPISQHMDCSRYVR